jgi:DNA-directed RNA polymerase subunit RPC12/RpoP
MQEFPLSLEDIVIKQKFDSVLAEEEMRYCLRCKEHWFDIQTQREAVCKRCHQKYDKKKQDEPFFYSAANHLGW